MTVDADTARTSGDSGGADQQVRGDPLTHGQGATRKDGSPTTNARGWSWPPFEVANLVALKHGANSERHLSPIVEELTEWAIVQAPWLAAPAFAPTVARWAWAEAETILRRRDLDDKGVVDAKDDGFERRQRIEDRGHRLANELGLGPVSLAKLLGQLGSIDAPAAQGGLDALKTAGAELVRAAEQRALSPVVPRADDADDQREESDDQS